MLGLKENLFWIGLLEYFMIGGVQKRVIIFSIFFLVSLRHDVLKHDFQDDDVS